MTKEEFINICKDRGLSLNDTQTRQLDEYASFLKEYNQKINLTAITEYKDVCVKHFLDCASIINSFNSYDEMLSYFSGKSLVDVGTGAGFPGIPLKILVPELNVTLIDSLDKRVKFLNEVISSLELKDIEAIHSRAEEGATGKYREKFDIAVSRAVANLSTLSEYCLPYVKTGGVFVAYKSEELLNPRKVSDDELAELDRNSIKYLLTKKSEKEVSSKAINILGGSIENIYEYSLIDNYRCLCVIRKEKVTPKKYPRKAGLPSKEPIV